MVRTIDLPETSPHFPSKHLPKTKHRSRTIVSTEATHSIRTTSTEHTLHHSSKSDHHHARGTDHRESSRALAMPKAASEHYAPYDNAIHLSGLTPSPRPFREFVYAHEFEVTLARYYPYVMPSPPQSPPTLPMVIDDSRPAQNCSLPAPCHCISVYPPTHYPVFRGGLCSSLEIPYFSSGDAQAFSPHRRDALRIAAFTKVEIIQGASSRPDSQTVARRGSPPRPRREEEMPSPNSTHTIKRVRFADNDDHSAATCMQVCCHTKSKMRKILDLFRF